MARQATGTRDLLVGVLPTKRDLQIALNEGWYRIPVDTAPKRCFPPRWLAFYEGKSVRDDVGIHRFAEVTGIELATREELIPGHDLDRSKAGRAYHRLWLGPIHERTRPVVFPRPRPFSFLQTTKRRFDAAVTVNDLFADSPLEDILWRAFKDHGIAAERQWPERVRRRNYFLDFALFCIAGKIDVEADGDTYHITTEQAPRDNERNNELAGFGWSVLRFESERIRQRLPSCIDRVMETIQRLGGLDAPLVPTRYVLGNAGGATAQLSLFESPERYDGGPGNRT